MRFFRDASDDLWPASKIERIFAENRIVEGRKEVTHYARLEDGSTRKLAAGEYDNLRLIDAPYLPAGAGHYVLHLDFDGSGNDPVYKAPVVAWVSHPDDGLLPVTGDGVNDGCGNESLPIMYPDGTVKKYGDQVFTTIDEFIENEHKP